MLVFNDINTVVLNVLKKHVLKIFIIKKNKEEKKRERRVYHTHNSNTTYVFGFRCFGLHLHLFFLKSVHLDK